MSKKIRYILVFLVLALIVAVLAWRYTFRVSESSVSSHKTDVTIDAPMLLKAFEANEDSANVKYRDKIILVTGQIGSITQDSLGYSIYLKDNDAVSGIMCRFDKPAFNPALSKVGSRISIKGICNGYLMDVVLNKCSIEGKP